MTVKVAYFDNAGIELSDRYDPSAPGAITALDAFLTLTSADRLRDTWHVFAYYQDVRDTVGGEEWLDEEMGVPQTPEEIWSFVHPKEIGFWSGRGSDNNCYIFLEADCGWEQERGLLMVWRDGTTLNKVGGINGHPTNVNAYGDQSLQDVVYYASSPEFTTRLREE